jgi:hypothetical protein
MWREQDSKESTREANLTFDNMITTKLFSTILFSSKVVLSLRTFAW